MPLLSGKAEPGKQGVVDHETALEQSMVVVAGERRQAERDGVESGCLRGNIGPCSVGSAHDQGEPRQ